MIVILITTAAFQLLLRGEGLDPGNRNGGRASGLRTSLRPVQQLPGRRAILTRGGTIHSARTSENALVRVSICAEVNAATKMAFADPEDRNIDSSPSTAQRLAVLPCGAAANSLREFGLQEVVATMAPNYFATNSSRSYPTLRTGRPAMNCELGIRIGKSHVINNSPFTIHNSEFNSSSVLSPSWRPNVGKSTLGQQAGRTECSITSSRPQTTRSPIRASAMARVPGDLRRHPWLPEAA